MYATVQFRLLGIPINSVCFHSNNQNEAKTLPHINLIKWPRNSPNLNPIENFWIWMKRKLREQNNTSIPMLEEVIRKL